MSTMQNIRQWGTDHHPRWLVILRMALGICLFFKGITFMANTALLDRLLSGSPWAGNAPAFAIIITWANLLGGFMLTVGLWTRFVALLQLPILIGAIVFINAQRSGFAAQSELGLAVLVLLLLILFIIVGSGPLSLDGYLSSNREHGSQGRVMP